MTASGDPVWVIEALPVIRARYPASSTVTRLRCLARAASCETATPTANSSANVVTSDECAIENRS